MPFMFVYSPALLMVGTVPEVIRALCSCMVAGVALSTAVEGYAFHRKLPAIIRIANFAAAVLLIDQGLVTDIIGLAIVVVSLLYDRKGAGKAAPSAPVEAAE